MAFTASVASKTVYGDHRVHHLVVTADAAAGAVDTGLGTVHAVQVTLKSATTAAIKTRINVLESATAAAGYVAISGAAAGDEFFLTVFGR
jgi:hypothetical protein